MRVEGEGKISSYQVKLAGQQEWKGHIPTPANNRHVVRVGITTGITTDRGERE